MNQSTSYAYHMWPGLSEDLRRVCRKYGIRTVFNIISTLRQQLTKLRRSRMKNHFSRKLQNPLQLRPRIHRRDQEDSEDPSEGTPGSHQKRRDGKVRHSRAADSWTKHHRPIWDEPAILDQTRNNTTLLSKEAFYIKLTEQEKLLNRDQGTTIADCWRPLLRRVHGSRTLTNDL